MKTRDLVGMLASGEGMVAGLVEWGWGGKEGWRRKEEGGKRRKGKEIKVETSTPRPLPW